MIMNMKTRFILASLLLLVTASLSAQDNEPVKKYGFKSAIVKISTDMMGQKIESTAYIDEYGAKECQKLKLDIPGMGSMESGTIAKDGKTWSVNYTMKQVQEVPVNPGDQPNFNDLTDEMKEKFKIKEVGTDKVLDKDCIVYTLETETQGMLAVMKVWCYKGLSLKSETEVSGMKIVAVATDFKEDAIVLPQVFEVPKY